MLTDDGINSHLKRSDTGATGVDAAGGRNAPPLRLELFSEEQRRERGRALAQEHHLGRRAGAGDRLLKRLRDNETVLRAAHRKLVDDVTAKKAVTPVGEWLVDNFYVIEEQISLAERHLPRKYLLELPMLGNPGRENIPRVYDLAEHIIAYGDSRVDIEDVGVIVTAYEEITPLNLGELWAVPIMLRLAIIENIRRLAVVAEASRDDREAAERWTEELIRIEQERPSDLIVAIADMARTDFRLNGPFVAEFKRLTQGRGSGMKLPFHWIEQNLNERGHSVDQLISEENHRQTVMEVSMRNCVNSLRNLNVTDWKDFVESMSRVERLLQKDPANVYPRMDFASRDDYRGVVERLARVTRRDEAAVAAICLDLAREAAATRGASAREAHVGYYLVGEGARELRRSVGLRGLMQGFAGAAGAGGRLFLYLASIAVLTVFLTALTAALAHAGGVRGDMLLVLTILLAFATCHLAVGLVNLVAVQLVPPRRLPRLDFSQGIPAEARTLVVVPVLLSGEKGILAMLRNLESHYLNNRGEFVHFALLTDFPDADSETMEGDERLLNLCRLGIMRLNDRYGEDGGDNFLLFHRPRLWNPAEKTWMARERKRGKLEDLNRYLLGRDLEAFSLVEGRAESLASVRYVITLDADTMLPRDSAWRMAGTMAHPLIRPLYDRRLGRVVAGHGILQPRVESTLSGANRSRYARMSSSERGVDPYTRTSSDVYQDLFDEGSFVGKGIYDVAIFNQALDGRFPDNQILSHDLLEGSIIRSGLIGDVVLYEDPPQSYLADIARRHRWIRGDWQIASYLVAREVRDGRQTDTKPLNLLSQWKVLDNLRRSLTSPVLFLLLALGLAVLTHPALYLLVVSCVLLGPVLVSGIAGLARKPPDKTFLQHVKNSLYAILAGAVQVFFKFSCLPFEALVASDAIVRSLWRQCVSRRRLLQWNPSDNSYNRDLTRFRTNLRHMWIGPVAAAAMVAVLIRKNPDLLVYAAPLIILWFLSPLFAAWLSKPRAGRHEVLTEEQGEYLRGLARRIWLFFEDFVGEEDNWLPPDNYQESPAGRTAHRTSPTNMGLALLANLSARDFGYVTTGTMLERCEKGLETMTRMERYRGHFFNWYDTRSLEILHPAYISSVDSGNLAAHLLILAAGLREIVDQPVLGGALFSGLRDAMELAAGEEDAGKADLGPLRRLIAQAAMEPPTSPAGFHAQLLAIARMLPPLLESAGGTRHGIWLAAMDRQLRDAMSELEALVPWASLMKDRPEWSSFTRLATMPTLLDAAYLLERMDQEARTREGAAPPPEDLRSLLDRAGENARARLTLIQKLQIECEALADLDMDFLYDGDKNLLAIGFNSDDNRLDNSFYDLLASEARLAVYLGVAQNKIPQKAWFAMGRLLTLAGRHPLLVSWSGSMFEYLMPLLVMPTYEDSLLDETYRACVQGQIEYGGARGVPWGISESGYYLFDADNNYQYRGFGVPELGLKHSLSDDLVVAPYATVLAVMVYPGRAAENLRRMAKKGFCAEYGFYEAIDYTASRVPAQEKCALVRSFMVHHQGMSLVALGQALLDRPMHRRFEATPRLQSASMLLQEMVPAERAMYYHSTYSPEIRVPAGDTDSPASFVSDPNSAQPQIQLLSNGNYHVMITAAGGGYSRWREYSLTRWREDATMDNWGMFCYIRDREADEFWSAAYQPVRDPAGDYHALFTEGKAEFHRRGRDIDCHTEIVVAPDDDVEVRRLKITNRSSGTRNLEVSSYAEVVLNLQAADDSHQAFSKLFVQTRLVRQRQAIVCGRRASEGVPLMFHMLAVRGSCGGEVTYETDRLAFLGRGGDAADPAALREGDSHLADGEGAVLDPIVAIRTDVTLGPGETVIVDLITGVGCDEGEVERLLEKYQDQRMADKAFDTAFTHGQLLLRQLDLGEGEARSYCMLAGSVVYANPAARAEPAVLVRNRKGQSGLWGYALSGDLPIVLVKITDASRLKLVRQLIKAHTYWRQKGLKVDLMIWNEDLSGYRQDLHEQIMSLAGADLDDAAMEKPGGIFVRPSERVSPEDRLLIETAARIVLSDAGGMLDQQLRRLQKSGGALGPAPAARKREVREDHAESMPTEDLEFWNGYGGFTRDGREYVVVTRDRRPPPSPWVNVLANDSFGCVVSEAGSSYTWSENAHEFRLTPWYNDPVSDPSGEAIYLRDENSGHFWSPTPGPCAAGGGFVSRHGFGYSVFEHSRDGIASTLTIHVDKVAPVKFFSLKVVNNSSRRRSLSATALVEWVLGDLPDRTGMFVTTGIDSRSGALFARNHYNDEFRGRTAFLDVDDPGRTVCGDRREFLGRNGSRAAPAALRWSNLSGRVGPGLDPCGAVRMKFTLAPGQEREVIFRLGAGRSLEEARGLVARFRGLEAARASLDATVEYWRDLLGTVQVETPDKAFDFMANGWLLYQALACRFWGRSATYQSGGAFGFRDQLQDSLAFLYAAPALTRKHILDSAKRQFPEGDVQHWWHPPSGRGVRTQCSDDFMWLPYVVERYVSVTGDAGILEEEEHFIEGRTLRPDEESYYDLPQRSEEKASLYEHCRRSIRHGMRFGPHGLPLMGSGDWNDGMDRVGMGGPGESVWLAFFFQVVWRGFASLAEARGDDDFARECREAADRLGANVEAHAWDGEWYRRAYFGDGTPLGSAAGEECRIDAIVQSWSVMAGARNRERSLQAMRSLDENLVDHEARIIKLFAPPFDRSPLNPGYIKGYVPGVRENGGQYTHGVIWAGFAHAMLGNTAETWDMLQLLNPINHALTREWAERYKVEPYVVAADIYSNPQHSGRGGWTWYTGSASWLYRLMLEGALGFGLSPGSLKLLPCIPEGWRQYRIRYRRGETLYVIDVKKSQAPMTNRTIIVDGVESTETDVAIVDDNREHTVEMRL